MLDYLKKVSSILTVFLIIFVSCAATPPSKKIKPLFDDRCETVLNEVGNGVANTEWNFQSVSFNKELDILEKILRKHGVSIDDYYLAIMKFIAINDDGSSFYVIVASCYLKGISNDWKGTWTIIEGEDTIIEEIEKSESNRISEKQYL